MHFHLVNAVICLNIIFIVECAKQTRTLKSIWFDLFIRLVLFIDNTYMYMGLFFFFFEGE